MGSSSCPEIFGSTVPLPETIPVRYTEEEAGYVSFRPVVRQTFRFRELLDMVLTVTGKDPERIHQILRSGTLVFHFYRYWWEGFEADGRELLVLLGQFPDPEPSRPFRAEACTMVLIESSGSPPRSSIQLARSDASRRSLLRRRSFWDALVKASSAAPPAYHGYSYAHRADLYRMDLTAELRAALAEAHSRSPRALRRNLQGLHAAARIVFICPRGER